MPKRFLAALLALLLLAASFSAALAEGEDAAAPTPEASASPTPPPADGEEPDDSDDSEDLTPAAALLNVTGVPGSYNVERTDIPKNPEGLTFDHTVATAANAALLLRSGADSEAYAYWETALGHAPQIYRIKKATIAMLKNAVGTGNHPLGRAGMQLQQCEEVPLPTAGEPLQKGLDYNLHGTIYTDSPLTGVTAEFAGKDGKNSVKQTVTFDPGANVLAYSLVSEAEPIEKKSLDTLVDVSGLPSGRYNFTITAKTSADSGGKALYTEEIEIDNVEAYVLTQNKFDDNYLEANRFFQGNKEEFLFKYWLTSSRNISTETVWRDKYVQGESKLGRVHARAVPYFDQAGDYLDTTYFAVTCIRTRTNGEVKTTIGRVTKLMKLMKEYRAYVPRFQSNLEYLSHHTLGTAMDVNDNMYPNTNTITNHELIGNDVKYNLVYNGIKTDEKGQQYYDFTYTGDYKAKYERVPTTIINYLLYELAFYRAGFQWGFYYETACDGMHFMLSEDDSNRHMDSDVGLRKVYEYYN